MVNWDDIRRVETILRDHRPFLHQTLFNVDFYDFVSVSKFRGCIAGDLVMILDRNVLSRAFELLGSCAVPIREEHRLVAAVFAYAQFTDIEFDPSIALAETVHANGRDRGEEELAKLVALQNIPVECFLSIATGRADRIDKQYLEAELTPAIVAGASQLEYDQWPRFEPDYAAALKIALLLRKSGANGESEPLFKEFLQWCYEDFIFTAPAIFYGSLALSPARKKGMFKRVHGADGQAVLTGVLNATWDLALIRSWMDATKCANRDLSFTFVCSFDNALQRCAKDVIVPDHFTGAQRLEWAQRMFVRDWREKAGARLSQTYAKYVIALPAIQGRRGVSNPNRRARWREMITDMERELALATNLQVSEWADSGR